MRHEKTLRAAVVVAFVLGLLLMAGSSYAQAGAETAPKWVANAPATGFLPCYRTAASSQDGITSLQVTAVTDTRFSVWSYSTVWRKLKPEYWYASTPAAVTDSVITVLAGETQAFRFPSPRATALYLVSGEAYFSGE